MEFKIKEESSFLPHDLIDDIENDSLDSTEEISNIINRPEEINQFNSQFNNSIYEQNFNHYKSFSNLPFLTYFQNFQEKNSNSIPYVRSMDDMQNNIYINEYQNFNFFNYNERFNFKDFLLFNKTNLSSLIMSYSGSHFLQKIINHISKDELDLLLNLIVNNLKDIMCNSYGNYFFQKIIKKSDNEQRIKILNGISKYFIEIAKDISGNHCIQTLIDTINTNEEEKIIKNYIINYLMELSLGTNSNHVIQKLISGMNEKKKRLFNEFYSSKFFYFKFKFKWCFCC